ncbi:MAG: hypothetical protein AAFP90_22540, partial [Planctomycetota bacterium]
MDQWKQGMGRWSMFAVALLAFAACAPNFADAQDREGGERGPRDRGGQRGGPGGGDRGGRGGFGGFGGQRTQANLDATMMGLLQVEEVRMEIELMPDQEDDLKDLQQSARPDMSEFRGFDWRGASEDERNEMMTKMRAKGEERAKEVGEKFNKIIMPEQKARLRQ